MIAVALAFGAALSYGLSDFIGGLAGRRTSAWRVAAAAGVGGTAFTTVAALTLPGTPTGASLCWAVLAGLGNGLGTGFLYRGLAAGRMGVVSPVSGVTAAALPVIVGVLSGERPSVPVWVGIAVALPAIWLVAREPDRAVSSPLDGAQVPTGGDISPKSTGVADGLLAGAGFGLLFAALAQVPDSAGFWPLAVTQAVGILAIAVLATLLAVPWVPRDRASGVGALSGLLGGLATLAFLVATQHGYLAVSAVLTSLYPAGTVLLAAAVLREHVHRTQAIGLAMCAVTVVLVATGG